MPINIEDVKKNIKTAKDRKKDKDNENSFLGGETKNFNVNTRNKSDHIDTAVSLLGKKSLIDAIAQKGGHKAETGHNVCLKTQKTIDPELSIELLSIKKLVDNVKMEQQIKSILHGGQHIPLENLSSFKHLQSATKAYDSVDWAAWIPSYYVSWTYEELELPFTLESQFMSYTMQSKTDQVPLERGTLYGQLEDETSTSFTAQSTTADKISATAKNNVIRVKMWNDFLEDNIDPALFDKQRLRTATAIARSFERSVLNGDDSTTHMDSNVTDPKDFRKAFKGLRKLALDNSANGAVVDAGGSSVSLELIQNIVGAINKESDMDNMLWILPSVVWNGIITGKIPEVLTTQNVGTNATLLTGQMFPLFGINAYKAGMLPDNLNATGVHDGVTTSLTSFMLIDKTRFTVGNRTPIRFWISPKAAGEDSLECCAKARHTFVGAPQDENEKSVVSVINLAP